MEEHKAEKEEGVKVLKNGKTMKVDVSFMTANDDRLISGVDC